MSTATAGAADWRERAACRLAEPDLFFPVSDAGPSAGQVAEAKKVCASCPVRGACLDFAQRTRQGAGIWGGTTETERLRDRRAERRSLTAGAR